MAAAGAVVALGLTAAGMTQQPPKAPAPPPRTAARRSETANKAPDVDPRWVKSLPNGATIEVVAVSPHPSGPNTWWRPDGAPLEHAPCDASRTKHSSDEPVIVRAIAVRISNLPTGADSHWWIAGANGGSLSQAAHDGKPVDGLSLATTLLSKDAKTCTILFRVAAGPWETVHDSGNSPGAYSSRTRNSFIFSDSIATPKGTALSVSHDIEDRQVRIVAVDKMGETHPGTTRSGSGLAKFRQLTVEFDLPPDQIKGYRVQAREYEKLEIPNVSLKPFGPD